MLKAISSLALLCCFTTASSATVVFEWAIVGDAGNAPDITGSPNPVGAVAYNYRISKHEVTNDQYVQFLNKVAKSDRNGLFDVNMDITQSGTAGSFSYLADLGFETHPVSYVSFLDAMRFVNWLENGQGPAGTETGVYSISDGTAEVRATGAKYFIPSEDEWYKAAYFDPTLAISGGYWDFPTRSNTPPTAEAPPGGSNSANVANPLVTPRTLAPTQVQ